MGFSWPRAPREVIEALQSFYGIADTTTLNLAGNALALLIGVALFVLLAKGSQRARAACWRCMPGCCNWAANAAGCGI
ncbi:hypothetical protein ASALC70_02581 [Alcanivorax sp. ALC70]|nr:hypothetical protein ASALC70_02581 [Alcanivorax sp. ALC70]